ncbi:MAG: hypothetical protein IT463_08740 [Planctomycetes bacterium]|nr:hypothetical protein [Planctomycetota bacterium]
MAKHGTKKAPAAAREHAPPPDDTEESESEALLGTLLDETHKVLKTAVERAGPKRVARALDVSLSLVYKWTQPPRTKRNPQASGASNPLDKLITIYALSQDLELVHFLCRVAKGYYAPNPGRRDGAALSFVTETVHSLNEFADLMHLAEKSLADDGRIDTNEAERLRRNWDRLKGRLEQFVVACEEGHFNVGGHAEDDSDGDAEE